MPPHGFLIPPWYHDIRDVIDTTSANTSSVILGFSLTCSAFSLAKMARQTLLAYHRGRLLNIYIVLIWSTWIATSAMSILAWLFFQKILPASFWTFFAMSMLWIVQIQCVLQVVANRLSFLVFRRSKRIRLAILYIMTFITVTGACTWLPGSLQLTPSITRVASIWDRCNKSLFSATDLTLNLIFLRMVWRKLVAVGLTKYKQLFYFNACMSFISISSDIILVAIESSPNTGIYLIYLVFNPLVFTIKLHIELNLAEMIAHIAQSTHSRQCGTHNAKREDLDRYNEATMIIEDSRPCHEYQASSEAFLEPNTQEPV